ncbi:hypothetical protein DFH09DRAFT_1129529 [Mycena vulgaris]|nr:hypothetical protein DFH09DRAFT_1129529 [Mycena vulgaris]
MLLSSLRLRLRPPRAHLFSTSHPFRNETEYASFQKDLAEAGDSTPAKKERSQTNRPVHEYKPIQPNSFIRPYDISLKGRAWQERPPFRLPKVAPATRDARAKDVFYQLRIDPLKLCLHPGVLSHFMTEMAMIHPRRVTGLTMKSQRRISKAIRRAKMMGIMPLHSRLSAHGEWF